LPRLPSERAAPQVQVKPSAVASTAYNTEKVDSSLALYIDPAVATCRHHIAKQVDLGDTLNVDFDVGEALAQTIAEVVQAHFRTVHSVSADACSSDTEAVLVVRFAKEPYFATQWVEHLFTLGGGTTAEIALAVAARRCDGTKSGNVS
jgi:hypothetical protein